ncbi:gp115 [Erwinia phage vB_EamP-S6]|uniref:Gp115 n=1 Tax=Erwinia phage vB_EamP-S6 TaxID=1051675 RepID=G0YQK7_9CAUD|nr:gp115 [Erwinia phage vB_EamP-S6]AEJ81634.1 gp115 [Erwinia phage vB_EamP-S6]
MSNTPCLPKSPMSISSLLTVRMTGYTLIGLVDSDVLDLKMSYKIYNLVRILSKL